MSNSTASLESTGGAPATATLDGAYRKITLRLIPFLAILWILAWLDRVNIGFAKLQMLDDLKFSEAIYGLGAGIFFLGYFFFEVPSNILLEKFGAKKTIMRITIGWGVTSMLMMLVTTPGMFYFLRFLLGVFEAGFYPGIVLYLTYWYPTDRRAKAFGIFMSASALAGIIGGPLAGAIMTNLAGVNGWNGWQWLFLLEGIPSVIAGIVTYFYLTDKPEQANWLTAEERRLVHEDLEKDSQGLGHREHNIMAGLKDRRVWLLIAIYFCLLCGNSTLTFWAPSVIRDVGFPSPVTIGYIAAFAYLLGACGMIWNGAHSDRHQEVRYHFGIAALLGSIGMLVLGLFINTSAIPALAAMTLGIVGTMSAIPVFWQLPGRFLSGTAAAAGIALINSIANLAGAGSPYMMGLIKTATGTQAIGWFIIAGIQLIAVVLVLKFIPKLPAHEGPKQSFH